MTLAELQNDFQSWLVGASELAAGRLGPNAAAGLSVYQNNYRAQLVGCLEQAFPQLRRWIGEDAFLHAAITHIDSHPPHAWTLDAYAADFGATLRAQYPDNPDLHELAWIEYALAEAFVAPDAAPLAAASLAAVDWDAAGLVLAPSFMQHAATTNAHDIWSALSDELQAPEGEMLDEPGGLVVWRRGYVSCLRQVDALEHAALMHLKENGSFAALCDLLVARLGDADGVAKAGALLANWLASDLISSIEPA
ncbi:MAG: DNA-binding domain-containing protein [Pseudomonadota bacterium]